MGGHPSPLHRPVTYESLHLSNDPGQRILVYTAEPGSKSQEPLNPVASWTATPNTAVKTIGELRS